MCGVGILLVLQRFHHFLVLPSLLLAIPVAFYIVAYAAGYDLPALREHGWVAPQQPAASATPPVKTRRQTSRASAAPQAAGSAAEQQQQQ